MSKIKNGVLDLDGTEPFEQQQIETARIQGVNLRLSLQRSYPQFDSTDSQFIQY